MKTRLSHWLVGALAGAAGTLAMQAPAFAGDVSVSVNLATPGVFGQLTIGGEVPVPPAPELLLPRAVVAVPAPVVVGAAPPPPMYLHVPPGYERHWARHCREYNACGRPVYFVSDRWYNQVYTPRYHGHHEGDWRRDEHERHEEMRHEEMRHEEHEREVRRAEFEHGHDHDRGRDHYDHDHDHGHDHDHDHDHDHR